MIWNIEWYTNEYGQRCTEVFHDGRYSRIPEHLTLDQAIARVKESRKHFTFKD